MPKKIFMYTGKGGVGKTSIASATSLISAGSNIKTILISIDTAHSLSDVFDIKIAGDFREIKDNLTAIELDSSKILKEKFPKIKTNLADGFNRADIGGLQYTSSFDMPFIVNILTLLEILAIYENYDYENIIVDCPASASTFAYLKFPEMLSWYLEKFFGVGKKVIRGLRPISKYKYKIDLPSEDSLGQLEVIYKRLLKLANILKDPNISTIRLVGLAEKMVIEESKRDLSYLRLFDYNVDGFFVNRLYEDDGSDFIKKRLEIQNKNLDLIDKIFYDVPIFKINLMKEDMRNLHDLEKFAMKIEDNDKLIEIKSMPDTYIIEKKKDTYLINIDVGDVDDVEVLKNGLDLNIRIKDVRRIISLPNILKDSTLSNYHIEASKLMIYLDKEDPGQNDENYN